VIHQLSIKIQIKLFGQNQRNKFEERKHSTRLQKEKAEFEANLKQREVFERLEGELNWKVKINKLIAVIQVKQSLSDMKRYVKQMILDFKLNNQEEKQKKQLIFKRK
jgi:hypothetical protein